MQIKYLLSQDKRVDKFNEFIIKHFHELVVEKNPEIIMVAGGDGAMLHAMNDHPNFKGIYFGKGMGTLNFLMNNIDNDKTVIEKLLSNNIQLHIVKTQSISVFLDGKEIAKANNDIIIGDSIHNYHKFALTSEDRSFNEFKFKGGGICISTPLGSTAFNFNNGGNILPLDSDVWALTGVVCNNRINDILSSQSVEIISSGGVLSIDGIELADLNDSHKIELKPGSITKIGFLDGSDFLERRVNLANRYRNGNS